MNRSTDDPSGLPGPELVFVSRFANDWREIVEETPHPDDIAPQIAALGGAAGWILQTFLLLKRRGNDVRISDSMPKRGLVIAHCDDIGLRNYRIDSFVVAIRADRRTEDLCDLQIVQNPHAIESPRDFFIPYWTQPGLVPRDPSRGDRVERVGFVGRTRNLAAILQGGEFAKKLQGMGVEFVIREGEWWNYSDLDIVIGLRDGQPSFLDSKPASKLVNAWMAGCPAIVGKESAFEDLRKSPLDFRCVASVDEAVAAVRELKDDSNLYRAMAENAELRREEFTADRIAEIWEAFLYGPATRAYMEWSRDSRLRRGIRFGARAFRARVIGRTYLR